MDPMTLAMLISAGTGAANATGVFRPDVRNQQPAMPAGGGMQRNPMGDFLQQFGGSHEGGDGSQYGKVPQAVQTPQATSMEKPVQPPATTNMEGIDPSQSPQENSSKNQKMSEIGDLIASIPEALAIAAPLLGLTGEEKRQQPAPTGGSALQNQGANFQNLPRPPSLGELLAALPRMR